MKILYQIAIIFSICFVSELISAVLPIFIPAPLIALLLLFLLLETKILKIDNIKEKSDFLLSNMAFFFIPAGVKVIEHVAVIKAIWWQFLLIVIISTILVFFITGLTVTLVIKLQGRMKNAK